MSQKLDNDFLWHLLFVGPTTEVRDITFAGQAGMNPLGLREYLLGKLQDADDLASQALADGALPRERCVFCRHQFGSKYQDAFFGSIEIRRNGRNRYFCNQCDYFIRICPGQATLVMPVLVVDVKDSRRIRQQVGDLAEYARLLQRFQQQVATQIQNHLGFVLNAVGDSVLAVWPSGFVPPGARDRWGGDSGSPARIPALLASETARDLARVAPTEFDGTSLPFRGVVDTTEMVIFAVTAIDPHASDQFAPLPGDDPADPMPGLEGTEIPSGPAAVDVAGEAVEVCAELASAPQALPGHMYVTRRTDDVAAFDVSRLEYQTLTDLEIGTRVA